jgi:hypothetical protein
VFETRQKLGKEVQEGDSGAADVRSLVIAPLPAPPSISFNALPLPLSSFFLNPSLLLFLTFLESARSFVVFLVLSLFDET